jgi:hypothetical protein
MKRILLISDCNPGCQSPSWTTPPIPPSQIPPWKRPLLTPQIQTITAAGQMSINYPFTNLVQSAAPPTPATKYVITLPSGNYVGQSLVICIPSSAISGTQTFLVVGAISGGYQSIEFNPSATFALIQWDGSAWCLAGGNAQLSQATS